MKKSIYTILPAVALVVLALTGCIKETFPESSYATSEQIGASATALEASVNGIPSQMTTYYMVYGIDEQQEYDMAWPGLMITMTECLGDIFPQGSNSGYDWYRRWNTVELMDAETSMQYEVWAALYKFVKSANDIIGTVDLDDSSLSTTTRGLVGIAYADRAFLYYTLMSLYEPVTNPYTDVTDVLGLTVPIVTDKTSGDEARNNPRATHEDMVEFILSDLETAEACFTNVDEDGNTTYYKPSSHLFPDLAVVYAVKARVYMWDGDYESAAVYARKAIDYSTENNGGAPMTESQWLDEYTAFNTATSGWLWYIHYDAENMSNLCNYIGWISVENDWGYAQLSLASPGIRSSLYDYIPYTDFRKHAFVDPDRSTYNYVTVRDDDFINDCPDYTPLKFRCVGGDYQNYSIGGACDVPMMRIEEMYYVEAEAVGRSKGVSAGVNLLNDFVTTYRDPSYNFSASDEEELAKEILKQMEVEFWGEGTAFATAKRIKPGVIQNYTGTNAPTDYFKINCREIKPNWNFVIPINETQANYGIGSEHNNPDATWTGDRPSPVDEYSPDLY